jgi:exodeoxyribonuclease VII large subunit
LLDEVADLRASTPTDAAKRVVPDVADELNRVQQARARLSTRLTGILSSEVDRIGQLRSRPVLSNATWIVDSRAEDLTRYVARGTELVDRVVERAGAAIVDLRSQLRALSPQGTLDRGYAIVQLPGGPVLRTPVQAPTGTALLITLADGTLQATSK